MDIDEIVDALHIKTTQDHRVLESMIEKMESRGSLERNGDTLKIVDFEEKQRIPPSLRPSNVAERVRHHRERRRETVEGEEAPPSPEAGTGKEAPPETSQDEEVLAVWAGVKNFPQGNEALGFLVQLKAEFPDVDILEESKRWAAAKLSKPLTRGSLPFKQLWTWMMKAREYGHVRAPKVDQDRDKYIRGRYGHMVHR